MVLYEIILHVLSVSLQKNIFSIYTFEFNLIPYFYFLVLYIHFFVLFFDYFLVIFLVLYFIFVYDFGACCIPFIRIVYRTVCIPFLRLFDLVHVVYCL